MSSTTYIITISFTFPKSPSLLGSGGSPVRPAGHRYYNEPGASGRYFNEFSDSGGYYNNPGASGRYYSEPSSQRDRMGQEEILSDAGGWPQDIGHFPQVTDLHPKVTQSSQLSWSSSSTLCSSLPSILP